MSIWDDRILEYVRRKGSGTPKQLAESGYVRVSPQHCSRRLQTLADHGLVEHLGNAVYVITDRGEQYLDGELDVAEDRPDDPVVPADLNESDAE